MLFHEHEFTVSGVFAGRKRWFIYDRNRTGGTWIDDAFRAAKRADPAFDGLDSMATFARALYPAAAFQRTWARAGYECVQGPNDLLYRSSQAQPGQNFRSRFPRRIRSLPVLLNTIRRL